MRSERRRQRKIAALAKVGCEIVRVTVPTLKDAQALPAIRAGMRARNLHLPLVADIHFSPKLAMLAALRWGIVGRQQETPPEPEAIVS